ncbi:MAG: RidA family protein [Pseudomonadota bacterium]
MAIKRIKTNKRMSQAVVHGNTVTTAGQVALNAPGESAAAQTTDILQAIDELLAAAGTDKSKLISATIWLANMADFAEMNSVWDAWVVEGETPARACVESKLAAPQFTVEIAVVAAID